MTLLSKGLYIISGIMIGSSLVLYKYKWCPEQIMKIENDDYKEMMKKCEDNYCDKTPEEIMKIVKEEARDENCKNDYAKQCIYGLNEELLKLGLGRKVIKVSYENYIRRKEAQKTFHKI